MADDLKEPAHESFKTPTNKDIKIWRYMDLAKYLAMLQQRSLFFSRATLLGDPFEGSSTKVMVAMRQHILENRGTDPMLASYKNVPKTLFTRHGEIIKMQTERFLVSCWHMNEHESAAMWSLYSQSNEAVCVQSTYRRLRTCLPQSVFIGEVRYIDYETESFAERQLFPNMFDFFVHKRKSFEHERELRAVFWEDYGRSAKEPFMDKIDPAGLPIPIDLPSLVERVHVSPTAAAWFAAVVRKVTSKYDLTFPVVQSALAASAVY